MRLKLGMNQSVEDVLLEIVDLCQRFQLQYVVLGGIAVRVHGIPRPTFDVDIELTVEESQLRLQVTDRLSHALNQQ